MENGYISITGTNGFYGLEPFEVGGVFKCVKEPNNQYDDEAIEVIGPLIGRVGYVANSTRTTVRGCMSAGRVYDKVGDFFFVKVMFITQTKIICQILTETEQDEIAWLDKHYKNKNRITDNRILKIKIK